MDILFASSNLHKKNELEKLLKGHVLHLPKEFGLDFDCDETGTTFRENALQKAQTLRKVAEKIDMPVLSDDSGLIVDSLPGELGVHTARFGSKEGEPILSAEEKNKLLLERLKGVKNRSAHFVCVLVLLLQNKTIIAEGRAEGRILEYISNGSGGFGYDPVFFSSEANGCFAELGTDAKNIYGHRAKAASNLLKQLEEEQLEKTDSTTPERFNIKEVDKWDLSSLYKSNEDFYSDIEILKDKIPLVESFKGRLNESTETLLNALQFMDDLGIICEKLGNYAYLNYSTEVNNPEYQTMIGTYTQVATEFSSAISFINPEILSIKEVEKWIEDSKFDKYRISLRKLLREREHILSDKEEAILSCQAELQSTVSDTFEALTNSDMDFGTIDGKPLTQSTFSLFMQNPDKEVRKNAYFQFYKGFESHVETLSKLYSGSVKQDIFNSKIRGFNSSLEASLYSDDIPVSVYTGLIETVHKAFPILHRYYSLKKEVCNLKELRHYDVYLPMTKDVKLYTPYKKACDIVKSALGILGDEYTNILYDGLTDGRWVDVYENKGKRSGAFSSGGYIGSPFILLNYKADNISDIFTVAHEGGHSMHTYYSKANNPYSCYNYTIFEAEVASTFNEQLLSNYLVKNADTEEIKKYILSKQLDDIVATLFRQTMFAEFELICHQQQENGQVLTSKSIRENYRNLLEQYFGAEMIFEDCSDLECLRIPHFYNSFYVYKYATGISAAIALSEQVLNQETREQSVKNYLNFLRSGGSLYPIESLKLAGVDMSTRIPVENAISKFEKLLDQRSKML